MSSRPLLGGALLVICLGVTGCTGRQILAMRAPRATPASPPAAAPGAPSAPFATMKNPLQPTSANLAEGKTLFNANCAPCHGASGAGDGPAAASLNPKPADFKTPIHAKLPDGYWFWRLTDGGSVPPFS